MIRSADLEYMLFTYLSKFCRKVKFSTLKIKINVQLYLYFGEIEEIFSVLQTLADIRDISDIQLELKLQLWGTSFTRLFGNDLNHFFSLNNETDAEWKSNIKKSYRIIRKNKTEDLDFQVKMVK